MSGDEFVTGLDFPEYSQHTLELWDNIAGWWDDAIGDGNRTQDLLEAPSDRLLRIEPGDRVLDIACGAGRYARRMAEAGAIITAIDQSEAFLSRARQRSQGYEESITYRQIDAADREALLALGESQFDAAVCTMAIMDMAVISPLISTLPALLKPGAPFVF
ncbi:MAG: class I SAM-dependent methyltransferase, partial [Chloroflexota bacterium]